jgi:DnaJ-domain-containing protein 1
MGIYKDNDKNINRSHKTKRMQASYYDILGVSPQAEDIVIRAAYRALAQRYHPDKSSEPKEEAANRMRAIQEAYQVLSDPVSRIAYDASLLNRENTQPYFLSTQPHSIANLEANAWEILLRLHPELGSNLSKLETKQMYLAKTYRSLLLELISEKLVANLVQSIVEEIKDIQAEPRLEQSRKTNLH